MDKNLIVKISEGLGNQLFMYANGYSISKKNNINFYIDPYSGYNKKSIHNFMLNNFNISSKIAPSELIFSEDYKIYIKKILIFLDKFKKKKQFLFEKKNFNKSTSYNKFFLNNLNDTFYLDGNFECEKYFCEYRDQILNEFKILNDFELNNNKYLYYIKNFNVVSITIRQNRFSERISNKYNKTSIKKSNLFVKDTINYVYKAIDFIKEKVSKPIFLVWSNDFSNLNEYFNSDNFIFVDNINNKILNDFYLLTQCKYFIVGPSTFSWWGAWLANHDNKICIRPKNINPSNNIDFWPENWISI